MNQRTFWRGIILGVLLASFTASAFAASYKTLRYRDQGSDVRRMQEALVELGYSTGGTDGKFGPTTEKAIRQFQRDNGLTVDGLAGSATLTLLYDRAASGEGAPAPMPTQAPSTGGSTAAGSIFGGDYSTLKYGSRGERVKVLQQALNDLGFEAGKADGKFGTGTQLAVVTFQQANGLEADGLAGRKTLKMVEAQLEGDTGSSGGTPSAPTAAPTTAPTTAPTQAPSAGESYLIPSRTLRKGYQGDDVKSVQSRLKTLGYYNGSVDGKYGSGSMAAVMAFQKAHNLTDDGLAGVQTYRILFSDQAKPVGGAATAAPTITPSPTATPAPNTGFDVPTRTLRRNCTGADVETLQKRLKELGYYSSLVDGSFGDSTVAAVEAFQEKHGLGVDGVAGRQTYAVLFSSSAQKAPTASATQAPAVQQPVATPPAAGWTTLKLDSTGDGVTRLQQALEALNYPVSVSSANKYDQATRWAVECFQRQNGLKVDGIAGPAMQAKLYGGSAVAADTVLSSNVARGKAPGGADLEVLHWYNDLKPYLQRNRKFTVYEPVSGKTWQMRLYSAGEHADSEPLTKQDSQTMYEVWGNEWSWDEKPVYIQLANGTWCIASMPNMPHLSGGLADNGFNGHTCVHFPRDMKEVQRTAPDNGGRHNRDIRVHWLKLTGEEIPW